MKKHILMVLIASVLAALGHKVVTQLIHTLQIMQNKLYHCFRLIFSGSKWGHLLQASLTMALPPILIGTAVYLLMRTFKTGSTTAGVLTLWCLWIMIISTSLMVA